MARDYSNGKIYVIRNHVNDMVYVGSRTTSLAKRWYWHKQDWKREGHTISVHSAFTKLGIDNFYIELYEECPCENLSQLERREGEVIRSFDHKAYNKNIAGRTIAEYRKDNKQKTVAYNAAYYAKHRGENVEKKAAYDKQYRAMKKAQKNN